MVKNTKNRIRKRRYTLLKEEASKESFQYRNTKNKGLSFLSSLFLLTSIALGVLIYGKTDENGKWVKENFGIELSFSKVNEFMSKYTDYILDFDIFDFMKEDVPVSNEPNYINLGNGLFMPNGNEITSIGEGTVIYVGENNGENIVVIQHDLGYTATYSGLAEVLVKKYDRVDDNAIIGVSFKEIMIAFENNNKKISYEEVLGILS